MVFTGNLQGSHLSRVSEVSTVGPRENKGKGSGISVLLRHTGEFMVLCGSLGGVSCALEDLLKEPTFISFTNPNQSQTCELWVEGKR